MTEIDQDVVELVIKSRTARKLVKHFLEKLMSNTPKIADELGLPDRKLEVARTLRDLRKIERWIKRIDKKKPPSRK